MLDFENWLLEFENCVDREDVSCADREGTATALATATASATATATATHPSMKEAALRAASTQGRRPPPCVDSFMDGCVAVAVAVTVA